MIRRFASPLLVVLPLLIACNKESKDAADAAPEAAVVVVADAALEAEAPAASASAAPLASAPVAVATQAKPTPVDPPICSAARSAKARKSPAAINLEAQCKAAGGKL